jgi:glutaredoxin
MFCETVTTPKHHHSQQSQKYKQIMEELQQVNTQIPSSSSQSPQTFISEEEKQAIIAELQELLA